MNSTTEIDRTNTQIEAIVVLDNWNHYNNQGVKIFHLDSFQSIQNGANTLAKALADLHQYDFQLWKPELGRIVPREVWDWASRLHPNNARLHEALEHVNATVPAIIRLPQRTSLKKTGS